MSKKKKISKLERSERRLKELQKASNSGYSRPIETVVTSANTLEKTPQTNVYSLPIKEIKKDLWKNLFYAGFSILVVIILKISLKV